MVSSSRIWLAVILNLWGKSLWCRLPNQRAANRLSIRSRPAPVSTSVDGLREVVWRRLFLFINPNWCDLTNRGKMTSVISFRFIINWIANFSKYNGTLISDWIDWFAYVEKLCVWRNFQPRNSAQYLAEIINRKRHLEQGERSTISGQKGNLFQISYEQPRMAWKNFH